MSPTTNGDSHGPRILIVDDEPPIAEIIAEVLGEEGYDTVVASGGDLALQFLAGERADLMLIDLYMPGLSGLDVLDRLRAGGGHDDMPVVVMTAGTADAARLTRHGAVQVLAKPFEVDALLATIRALV